MQENNAKSFVDPEMTERLKKAIAEKYKSKSAFAKLIGATYEAVRLWCDGQSKPNADFLRAIAKNTTISVDWLLTGIKYENKICDVGCDEHIMELCKKVKDVVESGTHWGASLEANIHSFKAGLDGDKERADMKIAINELKKGNADLSSAPRTKGKSGKKKKM